MADEFEADGMIHMEETAGIAAAFGHEWEQAIENCSTPLLKGVLVQFLDTPEVTELLHAIINSDDDEVKRLLVTVLEMAGSSYVNARVLPEEVELYD